MRDRQIDRSAGFTLVEVMIALAIVGFMMTIAWSTTTSSSQAKKYFESYEERNHEIRIALARLSKDISSAYLSANENQHVQDRRTLFVGKSSSLDALLRFSSLGHMSLWAEANESEQTLISYFTDSDLEDRSKTNLLRRESRRLSNESWKSEPAEIDLLLRDIEKVEFEYYDWRDEEWKDNWDSTAESQRGRLPLRVRVTIEIRDESGNSNIKYTTQARIMMQEQLRFFTN